MEAQKTFRQIAQLWLADKKNYVKDSTFILYSHHLEYHLLPALGNRKRIREADAQALVNRLLDKGLSLKSVKDIVVVLRMVLYYGARHRYCPASALEIHYPAQAEGKRGLPVFSLSEERRLLEYLRRHPGPYNLGIAICLQTGLRIGELCALTWADIDLDAGVIRIEKTLQRIWRKEGQSYVNLGTPKTPSSRRTIPLSADMQRLLAPFKNASAPGCYLLTDSASPMEPRGCRRRFTLLERRLNLPGIRFHGLRHSFATRCIESNCDYKTVSAILGHASISTTLNLYVHPSLEQKRKCLEQMIRQLQ